MQTAVETRCQECGSLLRTDAEWCGLCLAPVDRDEPKPEFLHADAFIGPPRHTAHSRWVKTDVSYGPTGRIVATFLLWACPLWWGLNYSPVMAIFWLFPVGPAILRSIWKKSRVRTD